MSTTKPTAPAAKTASKPLASSIKSPAATRPAAATPSKPTVPKPSVGSPKASTSITPKSTTSPKPATSKPATTTPKAASSKGTPKPTATGQKPSAAGPKKVEIDLNVIFGFLERQLLETPPTDTEADESLKLKFSEAFVSAGKSFDIELTQLKLKIIKEPRQTLEHQLDQLKSTHEQKQAEWRAAEEAFNTSNKNLQLEIERLKAHQVHAALESGTVRDQYEALHLATRAAVEQLSKAIGASSGTAHQALPQAVRHNEQNSQQVASGSSKSSHLADKQEPAPLLVQSNESAAGAEQQPETASPNVSVVGHTEEDASSVVLKDTSEAHGARQHDGATHQQHQSDASPTHHENSVEPHEAEVHNEPKEVSEAKPELAATPNDKSSQSNTSETAAGSNELQLEQTEEAEDSPDADEVNSQEAQEDEDEDEAEEEEEEGESGSQEEDDDEESEEAEEDDNEEPKDDVTAVSQVVVDQDEY